MGVTAIAAVNGRRKSARAAGGSYTSRYRQTMALLNRTGGDKTMAKKKRRGTRKKARRNPYGVRRIGDISKPRKKTKRKSLAKRTTRAVRAPKRRKARAKQPKLGRRYGPFKSLKAKIGIRQRSTFLYAGRGGRPKKIPLWAILKTKSKRDLESRVGSDDRLARRVVAAKKKRERAAARVMAHGDAFTPNRRRMKVIPYETWSASMEPNKRGKRKKAKRRGRKASHRRKAARRPKARGGARKAHRRTRKKKAGGTRRRKSTKRRKAHANPARRRKGRRRKARRNSWFNDHAGHVKAGKKGAKRRKKRRKGRRSSAKRRKHMMMNLGAAPAATPNRRRRRGKRRHHANASYMANRRHHAKRRHHGHRSYRRNPDFMTGLKEALKFGAIVGVGFVGHKVASKVISDMVLSKVTAFQTGSLATYRPLIGGLLAALIGVPLAAKFGGENGKKIAAGVGTSLLQTAVMSVLNAVGQTSAAGYLAGYPDDAGRAYTGYGEYFEPPGMSGYGAYEMEPSYPMSGFGAGPMITQAAAGYGAAPMITQAAAGYGQITQAAAGVGEFFMAGVEGIGDYDQVGQDLAYSAAPSEGIYPDLTSAERALNIAEAAAGVGGYGDIPEQSIVSQWTQMKGYGGFGDLPFKSIVEPTGVAVGVQDAPMGARAGILEGGDGIFG